ncbi:MAG: biotin transporter BioY [Thermoplasmatota archaeon]
MSESGYFSRYRDSVVRYHEWRNELDIVYKIMLALGFAALTGLMAQVRLVLPFSPVPITGQTFAVLLAGVVLGRWGGVSMTMYVGLGISGVPWFTNWQGGLGSLTGATGGYLLGFILAASFVGFMTERYLRSRKTLPLLGILLFSNFVLIFLPGLLVLYTWWGEFVGPISLMKLLSIGFIPFIIGDLLKVGVLLGLARSVLPLKI